MAKVLCVEIGCTTIKLCEMDYKAKSPKIYRCIELPTPAEAVVDGYLSEDKLEEVKEAIQAVLTENKIKTKKVVFSIYSSKIITREVNVPAVKKELVKDVVMTNVTEYFPIAAEDYVIAHTILETYTEGDNAGCHRTLVIAAEKALIELYEKLVIACNWKLINIDYTGHALYQAVKKSVVGHAEMFIKVEPENAIVSIVNDGKSVLQRTINYGAGIVANTEEELQELMPNLLGSLLRILDFYASMSEDNKIECIHLLGSCAEYDAVVAAIESETGIVCNKLCTLEGIRIQLNQKKTAEETTESATIEDEMSEGGVAEATTAEDIKLYLYAACIGAGYAPIGLAIKSLDNRELNYFSISIYVTLFVIVLGITICVLAILPYREEQLREEDLKRQEITYQPGKIAYDKYIAISDMHKHVEYGNKLTEHANDGLLVFLAELEEKLPADVSVENFSSDDEQAVITMRVEDKETAAGVIDTLRAFDSLMTVTVSAITEEEEEEEDAKETSGKLEVVSTDVSFTIYCSYYPVELKKPTSSQAVADGVAAEVSK